MKKFLSIKPSLYLSTTTSDATGRIFDNTTSYFSDSIGCAEVDKFYESLYSFGETSNVTSWMILPVRQYDCEIGYRTLRQSFDAVTIVVWTGLKTSLVCDMPHYHARSMIWRYYYVTKCNVLSKSRTSEQKERAITNIDPISATFDTWFSQFSQSTQSLTQRNQLVSLQGFRKCS